MLVCIYVIMNFNKSFEVSPELRSLPARSSRKPARNFLVENVKNLRQMQQQMITTKKVLEEKAKKSQIPKKRSEFTVLKGINKPVWMRYNQTTFDRELTGNSAKGSVSVVDIVEDSSLSKAITPKQLIDQDEIITGVQTSPQKQLNEMLEEESSIYSPRNSLKLIKPERITKIETFPKDTAVNVKERAVNKLGKIKENPEKQEREFNKVDFDRHPHVGPVEITEYQDAAINYVELNRRMEYKCKITKEKADPNGIPQNYQLGELPRYLKEKKKANLQSPKESVEPIPVNNERLVEQAPPVEDESHAGYVLLSDEERLEHLKMMNKHYEDLLLQFNQLPVRSDSLKAKQKRAELEKQLENMENSMKLFSRQKLYIKL